MFRLPAIRLISVCTLENLSAISSKVISCVALRADQHDLIAQPHLGIEIGDVDREHIQRDPPDHRAALAMDQDDALVEQRARVAFSEADRQGGDLAVPRRGEQAAVAHRAALGDIAQLGDPGAKRHHRFELGRVLELARRAHAVAGRPDAHHGAALRR